MQEIFEVFDDVLSDDEELIDFVERPRQTKVFRNRIDHMQEWNDKEFLDRFRISKECSMGILYQIEELLAHKTVR